MNKISILFLFLCFLSFSACDKDDVAPPTIVLTTPIGPLTAKVGDQINFEGTFTDPNELGKLEFTETRGIDVVVLKTIVDFDSKKSHQFSDTYTIGSDAVVGEVIRVGFTGYDVPGNSTSGTVSITIEQ